MKKIFFLILVVLFISGCKKYPEGGRVSGSTGRLTGEWDINEFTVDGADSLGQTFYTPICRVKFIKNELDGQIIESTCATLPKNTWAIDESSKELLLAFETTASAVNHYPLILNQNISMRWTIVRFKHKEFWIKTTFNGKEYQYKLHYFS